MDRTGPGLLGHTQKILGVLCAGASHILPLVAQQAHFLPALLRAEFPGQVVQAGLLTVSIQDGAVQTYRNSGLRRVAGAEFGRRIALEDGSSGCTVPPRVHPAVVGGQQAAVQAVGDGGQPGGLRELPVFQPLVDTGHDQSPHLQGRVPGGRHPLVLLKAHPDRRGVVGGVAHEPAVVLVIGSTGLAGDGHAAVKVARRIDPGDHFPQDGVDIVGGLRLEHGLGLRLVFQQYGLHAVHLPGHLGVGAGLLIEAAVGEHRESLRHVPGVDAVGQAAHGKGGHPDVALHLAAYLHTILQIEVEVLLHKVEAVLRGDQVGQHPHGHGVIGVGQGLTHGDQSPVAAVHVHRPGPAAHHLVGIVIQHGDGADEAHLKGGGVHRQRLDGGAGLTLAVGGEVHPQVARLLPHPAGDAH